MFKQTTLMRFYRGIAVLPSALAVTLISVSTNTMAGKPENITAAEMALIPAYCPYTQSFSESRGSPESKRWESVMGKSLWAMHHYCWAQINQLRGMRSGITESARKSLLAMARNDYLYVVNNTTPNFILLPDIYTRIGETELRLSRHNDANRSFAKARSLKPDYWPAYSHWAEFLMYSGKKAEAKQLIKAGLEYSPNSRVLREQYRLLGGNPSDIVPKAREQAPDDNSGEIESPPTEAQATPEPEDNNASPVGRPDR